jgi:hypothetical protein
MRTVICLQIPTTTFIGGRAISHLLDAHGVNQVRQPEIRLIDWSRSKLRANATDVGVPSPESGSKLWHKSGKKIA